MNRLAIAAVMLNAIVFAALIPVLEVNSSHLTNPLWPSHARLHEAWQLLTNAAFAIFTVWLIVSRRETWIAILMCLITDVSFLLAWATSSSYGGSMLHSDGTQMAVAGINVAVLVVCVLTALLLLSAYREKTE